MRARGGGALCHGECGGVDGGGEEGGVGGGEEGGFYRFGYRGASKGDVGAGGEGLGGRGLVVVLREEKEDGGMNGYRYRYAER